MVSAQQVTVEVQQAELVPYQQASGSVATQGFLDVISIIPTMMIMFFMITMMGMMKGFTERPEVARKLIGEAVVYIPKVGPTIAKIVKGE